MDVIENIALAIAGLKANKMRTVLTMLGIIIGIGSVIAIVTMGNSMSKSVASSMSNIGLNKIEVYVMQKMDSANVEYKEPAQSDYITEDMIEQFKKAYSDQVDEVSVSENVGTGKSVDGNNYANVNVTGVNQSYASAEKINMINGRFIISQDVERKKNTAVVSDRFVANMFKESSPIGQEIGVIINGENKMFTIVGVYQYDMTNMEGGQTSEKDMVTPLYIPSSTAKLISNTKNGYMNFSVITSVGTDQTAFTQQIKDYFNQFYKDNKDFEVDSYSMQAMVKEMDSMTKTITLAISAIAGISLLVGGIGVMNIMLVSITERTREIGTRKALGAPNSAIRFQFIVESIIICLIGGIIGTVVGIILGSVGAQLMGYPAAPSPIVILVAVSFSMAIGVFFGYYPANKAAKMNPIDALRYE